MRTVHGFISQNFFFNGAGVLLLPVSGSLPTCHHYCWRKARIHCHTGSQWMLEYFCMYIYYARYIYIWLYIYSFKLLSISVKSIVYPMLLFVGKHTITYISRTINQPTYQPHLFPTHSSGLLLTLKALVGGGNCLLQQRRVPLGRNPTKTSISTLYGSYWRWWFSTHASFQGCIWWNWGYVMTYRMKSRMKCDEIWHLRSDGCIM